MGIIKHFQDIIPMDPECADICDDGKVIRHFRDNGLSLSETVDVDVEMHTSCCSKVDAKALESAVKKMIIKHRIADGLKNELARRFAKTKK